MNLFIYIAYALWDILLAYWFVGYIGNKATAKREWDVVQILSIVCMIVGFSFLFTPILLPKQILPHNVTAGIIGDLMCAAGVVCAIWARRTLGSNWSGTITVKERHELVTSGPYRYVRHPIYTGFLLGSLGLAIVFGHLGAFIGVAAVFIGFWLRIPREEQLMTQLFPDVYPVYKKQTRALIPFLF
jgi:protein-S-isoprenylcysteine O-methyltransferase